MICIIVPVKRLENAKSRLSRLLDTKERTQLSLYLLEDLLRVITFSDIFETIVVGYDDKVRKIAERFDARFLRDESNGVNEAVKLADVYLKGFEASLIIPIDLILLEPIDLIMLSYMANEIKNGIIITPSKRLDGTNILLRKPSLIIDTYYDMDSYLLHIHKALEKGLSINILLNDRMMYDLDSIADIEYIMDMESKKKSIEYLKNIL